MKRRRSRPRFGGASVPVERRGYVRLGAFDDLRRVPFKLVQGSPRARRCRQGPARILTSPSSAQSSRLNPPRSVPETPAFTIS
jgi:hypothetical protein